MAFNLADNVQQNLKPASSKHVYYDDEKEQKDEQIVKTPAMPAKRAAPPPPPPPVISPTPPVRLLPPFFFARIFLVCFLAVFCAASCMLVVISWATKPSAAAVSIFPLATAYRGTSVTAFDFSDPVTMNVALPAIEASFQQHLTASSSCLCAHHLAVPVAMQICAIKDSLGRTHLMANPHILGGSNNTVQILEASILTCTAKKSPKAERFVTTTFGWTEPKTQTSLWALLSGEQSLCLQMAIDEMNGVKC